jgi:hypothetical protein
MDQVVVVTAEIGIALEARRARMTPRTWPTAARWLVRRETRMEL